MGPNNATNMEWPVFQPYDESKNGMANSKIVAEGNVASGQKGVYNQSAEYDSPPAQKSQSKFTQYLALLINHSLYIIAVVLGN